jgi:TPR repeat protein
MYLQGKGVKQDYEEAAKWYLEAAGRGHAAAQCSLGILYNEGAGVAKDYTQAEKWFRMAADQGNPAACYYLAQRYFWGLGRRRTTSLPICGRVSR